jgi:hypothetical protein
MSQQVEIVGEDLHAVEPGFDPRCEGRAQSATIWPISSVLIGRGASVYGRLGSPTRRADRCRMPTAAAHRRARPDGRTNGQRRIPALEWGKEPTRKIGCGIHPDAAGHDYHGGDDGGGDAGTKSGFAS